MRNIKYIKNLDIFKLALCLNVLRIKLPIYDILWQQMENIIKYITSLFYWQSRLLIQI